MPDQNPQAEAPRPSPYPEDERFHRRAENELCQQIAEREGDRLLKAGDEKGSVVAFKVAAAIRIRRDQLLQAF